MHPAVILVPVPDWEVGFLWYQKAFPGAEVVVIPEYDFKVLQIGCFTIEVVRSDDKVPSGRSGTVLYWRVDDLLKEVDRFTALGAELYRGPINIEHGLAMCQLSDPFGNLIGLRGHLNE